MPSISRRPLLVLIGSAISGCLTSDVNAPRNQETVAESPTPPPTRSTATPTYSPESKGPERCQGQPITVERRYEDQPGYDDDLQYHPENKTVTVVTVWSGDRPKKTTTWTFEEWGNIYSSRASQTRVGEVTAERLNATGISGGYGRPPPSHESDEFVLYVYTQTNIVNGMVESAPSVSFQQLKDSCPRSVNATVSLEGHTFRRTIPVFAEHQVVRRGTAGDNANGEQTQAGTGF